MSHTLGLSGAECGNLRCRKAANSAELSSDPSADTSPRSVNPRRKVVKFREWAVRRLLDESIGPAHEYESPMAVKAE